MLQAGKQASKSALPGKLQALEFFSGIGAFRALAPEFGITVVSAYDQSAEANFVYRSNFNEKPCARNLDTISGAELPASELWWLSPPCQPFTRRGKQESGSDSRSFALFNLLRLLPEKQPQYLALENVLGFAGSDVEEHLLRVLNSLDYEHAILELCPLRLGIPMKRPRLFYLARKKSNAGSYWPDGNYRKFQASQAVLFSAGSKEGELHYYLKEAFDSDKELQLSGKILERFADSLNIIERHNLAARTICFTSGYGKSLKASGSYIRVSPEKVRHFHPAEILSLFGFPAEFILPEELGLRAGWRLCGNSIDLHSLRLVLSILLEQK